MGVKRIVGFSGGADSQATALWVRQRYPKEDVILMFSDPGGNEAGVTYEFIENYSRTIHPVITVHPIVGDLGSRGTKEGKTKERRSEYQDSDKMEFVDLAYIKGRFPSTKARFCTEHLKLLPQKRWHSANAELLEDGFERYIGVRRDESRNRADVKVKEWDDYFDCYLHRPLATWSKEEVFDFLKSNGEEVNPLYTMGFSRVGCMPCINSSKGDIRSWAARFPEDVERIRRWEARVGRSFFPPLLPGKRYGFIDEVIQWSKTEHGGRQLSLPIVEAEAEDRTCVSKYGLCE